MQFVDQCKNNVLSRQDVVLNAVLISSRRLTAELRLLTLTLSQQWVTWLHCCLHLINYWSLDWSAANHCCWQTINTQYNSVSTSKKLIPLCESIFGFVDHHLVWWNLPRKLYDTSDYGQTNMIRANSMDHWYDKLNRRCRLLIKMNDCIKKY